MSIYLIRQFCSALFVTDKCAGEQTAKLGLEVVHAHTKDAHPEARLRLGQASLSLTRHLSLPFRNVWTSRHKSRVLITSMTSQASK